MTQPKTSSKFAPAQTPQARDIQMVALWIAARIGETVTVEDLILVRNTLLSLAENVEELENNLCFVHVGQVGGAI